MMRKAAVWLVLGCVLLSGCATVKSEKAFDKAAIGMSKEEAIKRIGRPAIVRGILKNDYGQTVEVWEYKVGKAKDFEQVVTQAAFAAVTIGAGAPELISSAETGRYWFYFLDGKFVAWSRAGDWSRDEASVRAMKFRPERNEPQMI